MTSKARIAPAMHIVTVLSVCLFAVSLAGDAHSETIPIKEVRTSTVRIIPVHIYGMELGEELQVDLFQLQNEKTNLAKRFHGGTASGIPYGIYIARVYASGFWSAERVVRVFQPNVLVVVGLQIGAEGGPPKSDVSGRIQGVDQTAGPIRVRISGIYSSDILDAEANSSGEFSFAGVPVGDYVLVTTQGGKTLGTKTIVVPLKESPVLIEVGDATSTTSNRDSKSNR